VLLFYCLGYYNNDWLCFCSALNENNDKLYYGVVVFGKGVKNELNIEFSPYSIDLINEIAGIPFNSDGIQGKYCKIPRIKF